MLSLKLKHCELRFSIIMPVCFEMHSTKYLCLLGLVCKVGPGFSSHRLSSQRKKSLTVFITFSLLDSLQEADGSRHFSLDVVFLLSPLQRSLCESQLFCMPRCPLFTSTLRGCEGCFFFFFCKNDVSILHSGSSFLCDLGRS